MKVFSCLAGVAFAALVPASIASAKTTRLQTVNITERQLSLEGGEAILYQVDQGKRRFCRIEVIHFGEMGKWIEVFDFGPKLIAAERKRYSYNGHFADPGIKATLAEKTTLKSIEGRTELLKNFEEYKTFFSPLLIAKCQGR